MDNQFCKNCGQANMPNAAACSKCGQALAGSSGGQFAQGSEPPPTMPPSRSAAPEKKSNMIYWVVGILALFVILGLGAMLLAGVGYFLYTSSGTEVAQNDRDRDSKNGSDRDSDRDSDDRDDSDRDSDDGDGSDSDGPMGDIEFPSGKDIDFGDSPSDNSGINDAALLKFFFEKKARVGKFTLSKVKTSTDKSIFPGRLAGAQAEYKAGRVTVTHRIGIYRSLEAAREDIATYKTSIRRSGARIRSSKESQVIYSFKGLMYLAFYNEQGGLHEISSRNGNDIIAYYKSYFKQ